MRIFTDTCDDNLELEPFGSGVSLAAEDGQTPEFQFDAETSRDLAQAILETVGASDSRTVSAKEITYNEGAMRLAAVNNKIVEFRYVKGPTDAPQTRRLVPSNVKGSGEHLRFTGYDPDRDETRSFRLDRIRGDVRIVVA